MEEQLASAMEHLVTSFFALAFNPDDTDTIATANEALFAVDRLLGAPAPAVQS
ncbi:hypothetical protein GCM10027589_08550 [Actinocorallia lasiicapitis]